MLTSVGGALTREGGDIITIDDPHNTIDDPHNVVEAGSDMVRQATLDWWDESMSNRLNDPQTGAYVLIMQRVHRQDLAGHLLDKGGWETLCFSARYESDHPYVSGRDERIRDGELLWPERFPEEAVGQLERDLGSYGSAGSSSNGPPRARAVCLIVIGPRRSAPKKGLVVRGWDLAASTGPTAAYSAGCKIRLVDGIYYIEDVQRFRASPGELEQRIKNIASQDGKDVIIDLP